MDDKRHNTAAWSLSGYTAHLTHGRLAGELNIARPDLGLGVAVFEKALGTARLLCTRRADGPSLSNWPLSVAEAYVRGDDIVATYSPTNEWPYAPQIYWQAASLDSVDGALASLSQLVSVQTHLLDSHPNIQVSSQVPSREALFIAVEENGAATIAPIGELRAIPPCAAISCVLWRLSNELSYIEIVLQSDVHAIEFEPTAAEGCFLKWRLFSEFLEKGVIRRARVHAVLLPHAGDTELAIECCLAAGDSPLPLTT